MIYTFQVQDSEIFENPDKSILESVSFAVKAPVHTTLHATPCQLVFGRDQLFNIKFEANWENICGQKQILINKNTELENKKRRAYDYRVGQNVLVKTQQSRKF